MTIAILPAGGKATRIYGIPKFMLPMSGGSLIDIMLDRVRKSGPRYIAIAATSLTAPWFDHLSAPDVAIYTSTTGTMTGDILAARRSFADGDDNVLFGMPDTYFDGDDVFNKLALRANYADVVVAVWPIRDNQRGQGGQCLVVESDEGWHIEDVVDKDPDCPYDHIWGALAWRPVFWDFLTADMPHVGYGLQPAIDAGLDVRAVVMDGNYYDCGTSERYFEMIRDTTGAKA